MLRQEKSISENAITLVSLVITVIILLILAGVAINLTIGENGILAKTKIAREEMEIAQYIEKIDFIKTGLQMQNENYKRPSKEEIKTELDSDKQKDWVIQTGYVQDEGIEKLILKTKEEYIFYITEERTEYKGKKEVSVPTRNLEVIAKQIDTNNWIRKESMTLADLFDIIWGSAGTGTVEYVVTRKFRF